MVKVIADSTCDLSKDLIERYDVGIIPLHILLGQQEYEDGVNISPDQIYAWANENKTTPKTSAPSIDRAVECLRPFAKEGSEIVCLTIASGMSTCINVIRMAAQELDAEERVTVMDSASLSTGIGLLVIEAAILAKEGKTAAEIAERIEELKPRVRASFVVDTLTYLHWGGRCSGVAAMAGGMLKLHPRIVVEEGKMHPDHKYRGKMPKVMSDYARDLEEDLKRAKRDRVFVTHSGCEDGIVESICDYLKGLQVFDEILVTRAGGVISSHCGYGTLGVLFIAGEE